jgi:hypothetical protein
LLSNGSDTNGWTAFLLRGMGEKEIGNWLEKTTGTTHSAKWATLQSVNPGLFMKLWQQVGLRSMEIAA